MRLGSASQVKKGERGPGGKAHGLLGPERGGNWGPRHWATASWGRWGLPEFLHLREDTRGLNSLDFWEKEISPPPHHFFKKRFPFLIILSSDFLKFRRLFIFLAELHGMQDLSSPTRSRTHTPCSGSPES